MKKLLKQFLKNNRSHGYNRLLNFCIPPKIQWCISRHLITRKLQIHAVYWPNYSRYYRLENRNVTEFYSNRFDKSSIINTAWDA